MSFNFVMNLIVIKTLKRYVRSYRIETIDLKDLLVWLEASKSSIKDLFKDLLDEIKGFKYQITVNVLLRKYKEIETENLLLYFNFTTKTVINSEHDLDKSFQDILYRIDNWINEGSGWIVEWIETEYANISLFSLSSAISYTELLHRLKN